MTTDKSVRFIFWDKEEVGLYGATAYASNNTAAGGRRDLQGTVDEPTWLGLIQHDMILYDHGAGTRTTAQSAYADLDVEWYSGATKAADSKALALKWAFANGTYAPDYPATAYNYSTNTDDTPFRDYVASVSVRENRRSLTSNSNAEWINPYYHTTSDVENSYIRDDDADGMRDDIELGVNAVKTTLGLVAELAGAHMAVPNTVPVANAQALTTFQDTPVSITLTASDADGDPLTYRVAAGPGHGALTGTPPGLTYTPAASYAGSDSFQFVANDGRADSAPATVGITVAPPVFGLPFTDDFETAKGWRANPSGTDAASTGQWERGQAQPTDGEGPKQLVPASGQYDLVTAAAAGTVVGSNDVDDGLTSVRSPDLTLPEGQPIRLAFKYTFSHGTNSSTEDYFRVKAVGATTQTLLELRGSSDDIDAAWTTYSADLSSFAGQTVYLLLEAADGGGPSILEAAVDDVSVTAGAGSENTLLSASFDAGQTASRTRMTHSAAWRRAATPMGRTWLRAARAAAACRSGWAGSTTRS